MVVEWNMSVENRLENSLKLCVLYRKMNYLRGPLFLEKSIFAHLFKRHPPSMYPDVLFSFSHKQSTLLTSAFMCHRIHMFTIYVFTENFTISFYISQNIFAFSFFDKHFMYCHKIHYNYVLCPPYPSQISCPDDLVKINHENPHYTIVSRLLLLHLSWTQNFFSEP
jgi:hypothetical protein